MHIDRHKVFKKTQDAAHLMYFALVFIEGHTIYAYTAGGLFVIGAIALLLHEDIV